MIMDERDQLLKEIMSLNVEHELRPVSRGRRARAVVVPPKIRRLFVAHTEPLKSLQRDVCDAAVSELARLFAFLGRGLKVSLLDPGKYPEIMTFSDGVTAVVPSPINFQSYLHEALSRQGENASFSLSHRPNPVTFNNPFAKRPSPTTSPDTLGRAITSKQLFTSGRQRFALPFMASVVALDGAMAQYVELVDSTIDVNRARKRRASKDLAYWGTAKALEETAKLSVLDNPLDSSKWLWDRKPFGVALGRLMAHEIRHLYVGSGHAADGLGRDSADVLVTSNSSDFSNADKRAILNAVRRLEKLQGNAELVPTFPAGRRTDFPF
jgi:hypothetical protein